MERTQNSSSLLRRADELRQALHGSFRDDVVKAIYADAESIAGKAVKGRGGRTTFDQKLDRVITSKIFGMPIMLALLGLVFWITIVGANYPSQMLAIMLFWLEDQFALLLTFLHAPWWLTGFLAHGVWRGLAWVIAVMLPPMAIFFPMFTFLEDLGYLPRVGFNLDWLFSKAGAHGKQALTMSMGFGCNAAGVIACRIIDSPRERLIAILTNNFVPCNGRFPTLIMLATVFVAAAFPPAYASLIAAGAVVGVVLLGVLFTFIVSWILSRTVLRGEASSFTLELPPYRRPNLIRILYTSLIDRTAFVLWRALIMAAPAGGVIWLCSNIRIGGQSITAWTSGWLDPFGHLLGLDGVILLAYIIAIPANEIVVPTMLMAYSGASMMFELDSMSELRGLLIDQSGWTMLTAVNLMLFSLLHNPCSTTIMTIWKETRSRKWTIVGALMPLAIAFAVTFAVAQIVRYVAG
ncbi:MAG: ferrous iron transporter B [Verrucomicrobia bacterium]|nr:ferrous iron transporter B [Verrucomicrobiota bacterium]